MRNKRASILRKEVDVIVNQEASAVLIVQFYLKKKRKKMAVFYVFGKQYCRNNGIFGR